MEEAERVRKRKKRNLQKSWSRKRKRWPWLLKDWGFCAASFGRKKEFAVEKSRFG